MARRVAACREAFEEIGVLLARYRQTREARAELGDIARSGRAFADLLTTYDLELNVDQLVPWSNWITPSFAPPVLFTLRELASRYRQSRSLADVLGSARSAAPAANMLRLLRTSAGPL